MGTELGWTGECGGDGGGGFCKRLGGEASQVHHKFIVEE